MIDRSTYVNALMDALPDVVKDADLANQIIEIVFSVPIRALENGNEVDLPGLGALSIDRNRELVASATRRRERTCSAWSSSPARQLQTASSPEGRMRPKKSPRIHQPGSGGFSVSGFRAG